MDWNGSANGAMQSPKKKLHLKVKDNNSDDDEMKNAVTSVRRNLKSGKDISTRNLETLMEHPRKPTQEEISYSSDYSEVVVIEEEPTDGYEPYVDSENGEGEIEEVEYEEEVIDDDGEEFEALPPPIKIPKALQHHSDSEDDHEDDSSYTTASSDEEEEEDDPEVERKFSLWRNEAEEAEKQAKKAQEEEEEAEEKKRAKKMLEEDGEEEDTFDAEPTTCPDDGKRPDKIRGFSYNPELPNPNKPMKKWTRPTPKNNETVEKKATAAAPPASNPAKKWTRPAAPRVVNAPKRAPSLNQLDANGRPDLAWTKPDWVSNGAKLRPTGKSAAANLAKPITNLPHMNKDYDDSNTTITTSNNITNNHDDVKPPAKQPGHATVLCKAPKSPSAAATTKASESAGTAQITTKVPVYPKSPAKAKKSAAVPPPAAVMKTPTKPPNTDITRKASLPKYPKSAPTAPRPSCPEPPAAELLDDDGNKVIEWEKPDWAQRRVLRSTSKTEALYAGKKIERPIGGIRPLEEEK